MGVSKSEQAPVNICGSSIYGRYPKISAERTWNMYLSDDWLINYAGFKKVLSILPNGEGRGFFNSIRGNFLLAIVSSTVYRLNTNLTPVFVGTIDTISGEVYIDENLSGQICIVDGESAYIYNYINNTFTKQNLMFLSQPIIPNYVKYHNSFFLIASAKTSINSQNWYAFERDTDSTIKFNTQFEIQTKPDIALAVVRLPGRGNNVLVLGSTVGEVWTEVGGEENYRRVQSFNIDSGVVSVSTIAASDEMVVWLSQNENNSPCIMVTDGGSVKRISTDGIDHLLDQIKHPDQSCAFFFRQDGHLFYQLTFYHPDDNTSLMHDFTTSKFYDLSDEKLNFHPAREIVFYNKNTYFISINDASIYKMSTDYVTYDYDTAPTSIGEEIPRIRICKEIRKSDSSTFRVGLLTFWIEQGVNDFFRTDSEVCQGMLITQEGGSILSQDGIPLMAQDGICIEDANRPRVDLSFSKNGNQSFSNIVSRELNPAGKYRNQISWRRMGQANEFTPQFRFWGFNRFCVYDGIAEIF